MRRALLALFAVLALPASGCQDPVHDGEVDALGPEPGDVSPGPLHRPGQPCLACHGGSGPAATQLTMGGTIYQAQTTATPLSGATVEITGPDGKVFDVQTNVAGNFYTLPSEFEPTYPAHVTVSFDGVTASMLTHIGRDGSCADCHFDPAGATTPGHIYLVLTPDQLPSGPPSTNDGGM